MSSAAPGPDDPVSDRKEDLLDRWSVARAVDSLIHGAPAGSALRIGVLGRWGEGKTSVLLFTEKLARQHGSLVARFNPWAIATTGELWLAFAEAIYREVDPPSAERLEKRKKALGFGKKFSIASALGGYFKAFVETAMLALSYMEVTRAEIEGVLRTRLGARRLVVLIDDLDRARPDIVPQLLLGLREVMALPNCFFVLALDPTVITDGLPSVHAGWGKTGEFLNKVIDYEFHLGAPSPEALRRLANAQVRDLRLNVPDETLNELRDLLPQNPRHLKKLLRGFGRVSATLARHDADETPWGVLLFLEFMRQTSPVGAEVLFRDPDLRGRLATATLRLRDEDVDEVVRDLRERAAGAPNLDGLVRLARSFMERVSGITEEGLTYWIRATDEPPAVTLRETRALLAGAHDVATLQHWLRDQAARTDSQRRDVLRMLLGSLIVEREAAIDAAINSATEEDLVAGLQRAVGPLNLIGSLVRDVRAFAQLQDGLQTEDFLALFKHFSRWAHFTNHPAHADARTAEGGLIVEAARNLAHDAPRILESLHVMDGRRDMGDGPEAAVLRERIVAELSPAVVEDVLQRFSREAGISALFGDGRHNVEKYFLLRRDSGVYDEAGRQRLEAAAAQGGRDRTIQANFLDFLELLEYGLTHAGLPVDRPTLQDLARDPTIVPTAWRAATARPIQPRMMAKMRRMRANFGRLLGGEDRLPVPQWWREPVVPPEGVGNPEQA